MDIGPSIRMRLSRVYALRSRFWLFRLSRGALSWRCRPSSMVSNSIKCVGLSMVLLSAVFTVRRGSQLQIYHHGEVPRVSRPAAARVRDGGRAEHLGMLT